MKYNYVIAGGSGFYQIAYSDLNRLDNVAYFENYIDRINSRLIKFATRVNFNLKLNQYLRTPLRKLVFDKIFPINFKESKPLCFIFFGTQFAVINTSYIEFIRKKYPSVIIILFMQDIVSSLPYYDIENYKKRFDLILSYDKNDCNRYNLIYYPTPFSYINPSNFHKHKTIDVYFCGAAKSRFHEILNVYKLCKDKGLSCKFIITGVPVKERLASDEIIYDKRISYLENLSFVYASRCVLEIMQKNAVGYTPRLWEALVYDKHLLSNNPEIYNSEFYNNNSIHYIDDVDNILEWINLKVSTSKNTVAQKSPIKFLEFIESKLDGISKID